jgi:hypothetical protein
MCSAMFICFEELQSHLNVRIGQVSVGHSDNQDKISSIWMDQTSPIIQIWGSNTTVQELIQGEADFEVVEQMEHKLTNAGKFKEIMAWKLNVLKFFSKGRKLII